MAWPVRDWKTGSQVFSVSISPDGSRIAAGCGYKVAIQNVDSRDMVISPLNGHISMVLSVAFSPDGRTIASGLSDHTLGIWDAETGETAVQPLTGHTDSVRSVVFAPDGQFLVSGSHDHTIRFWDPRSGRSAAQAIDAGTPVYSVAVSSNGRKIAAGCYDETIRVYATAALSLLFQCTGHTSLVLSVVFSPDGHCIASGSDDGTVCLWDGETGHAIGVPLIGHTSAVRSVSFSSDGKYIASASHDKTVRIWDVERGAMAGDPLVSHMDWVNGVAFMSDGVHLVSGSSDKTTKIWDIHHLIRTQPSELLNQVQASDFELEITSSMSLQDIISHLGTKGCTDMSDSIDWDSCSTHPISSGGFGDIYRGKLCWGQEVAIKTIRLYVGSNDRNKKNLKRAAREVYTWSKCRHPNVQSLLGLVVFRDYIGMISTWELNGSLPDYLEQHPETDRCDMSTQVSDGLTYLHASGVIHGDLKGANVLVSKERRAQLADFGNAVLQDYTLQFSKTTTSANYSVRWAAPELFEDGKCSKEADVYALGMTILEIITGDVPWTGKRETAIMFAVMSKASPERPTAHMPAESKYGDDLWLLLRSCWEFEPEKRPSAANVVREMKSITQEGLKSEQKYEEYADTSGV